MSPKAIDLRSDTVTKPTPAMRRAMLEAEVGDDVFGDDPTVNALETEVAELLGKERAVFLPSGTMANQIAVGIHARPGDELLCDPTAHVYVWEGGGVARLSGVTARPITPSHPSGLLSLEDLAGKIRPKDSHYVHTRLLCLENTHNRAGGRVLPFEETRRTSTWARENGLATHLDGARLMNAVVASGIEPRRWGTLFDTVSICFSKGLGAPVGSCLAGPADLIKNARRLRKVFGGGMRQSGILAAAARHALAHHVERLADDHANARLLGEAIRDHSGLSLESPVETNLVWIVVDPAWSDARSVAESLRSQGVLVAALGDQVVRACTHLDVSREDCQRAAEVLGKLDRPPRSTP